VARALLARFGSGLSWDAKDNCGRTVRACAEWSGDRATQEVLREFWRPAPEPAAADILLQVLLRRSSRAP
jgi:hypothetical protein